jgi:hypothetical protein
VDGSAPAVLLLQVNLKRRPRELHAKRSLTLSGELKNTIIKIIDDGVKSIIYLYCLCV